MLQNPYQYQAVPARPNISVTEDGCPHVATCNGFNASNTSTNTTTSNSSSSSSSSRACGNSAACRACTVCGTTKTPLWRSGPQGPKSLCNACGIRARKMHERHHHFPNPPPQTLAAQQSSSTRPIVIEGLPKLGQGTEVLIIPTGMTNDGSKYERRVWNHDVKIHGHPHTNHLLRGEFHCIRHEDEEDEDEDDEYHEDYDHDDEDDDDDDASDSCPSSSSSTPSQVSNKNSPLFPSIKHLSFKRKALRSPSSTSQRHMQPKPVLSLSFSKDDEQAALLLMSLSHGLTLNNK